MQAWKRNSAPKFLILSVFKLPLYGFVDMNTLILTEVGNIKNWKKIMQLLWTVVTYLLKNVEHGTELDVNSAYGECIRSRHFWTLEQI